MKEFNTINEVFNDDSFLISRFDFIAVVISGWHLLSVYSYLNKFEKQKGLIILSGDRIKQEMIIYDENKNFTYIRLKTFKPSSSFKDYNRLKTINSNTADKEVMILTPYGYNINFLSYLYRTTNHKKYKLVKYDEGIGSYLSEFKFKLAPLKKTTLTIIKIFLQVQLKRTIVKKLKKKVTFDEFFIYKRKGKYLVPIECNLLNYKKTLSYYEKSTNKSVNSVLIYVDYMLDRISETNFKKIIKNIINVFVKLKYDIFIKFHPYDSAKFSYLEEKHNNIKILENNLDAEVVYGTINPKIVLGGVSTSTYNVPVLYDKTIINYSMFYNNYKITRELRRQIKRQYKQFSWDKRVIYCNNIEMLEETVERIRKTND